MPDPIFAEPRLAAIYDALEPERADLVHYVAMVREFGSRSVLDVGCGTGSLAVMLAANGNEVVGVDPAAASLDVAMNKPGADRVRWFLGDATTLPPTAVDMAVMTGNVAQVFVEDDDWSATLVAIRTALRPGGRLVFESRDPRREAWHQWTPSRSRRCIDIAGVGIVESWVDLLDVQQETVSFRWTYVFQSDGSVLTSDSMLRFRPRAALTDSLYRSGYQVDEIRDAPDRPGQELVYVARRAD